MFTIDYSQAQEFATITDGTYEVVIKSAKPDASKGGTDFMNIQFKIRDDFEQKFKNNLIFHKIWVNKETQQYNANQINTLAKTAQLPDGAKYAGVEEFLNALVGKHLRVTVRNEKSEYNGNTYENLNVKKLEKSSIMPPAQSAPIDIKEDDLPF